MYGAQLIQFYPKWFVFLSNRLEGALVYDDDDLRRGVFLYPDNISCIRGTWRNHLLEEGRYCQVEGVDENEDEELIIKSINLIKSTNKASTSFLQRNFQIGYNKAARVMEALEHRGVVSSPNHTGKREILINSDVN